MTERDGPAARAVAAAARALLPLAALLALVALADYADWGEGPTRAAALALAGAALALLWRAPLPGPPRAARAWLALAAAVALVRAAPALEQLSRPTGTGPNDIGYTTARAVNVIASGRSAYASLVDPQRDVPRRDPGFGWFMGYKYGPVVPRAYAPLLRALGMPRGLYATNALLLAAAAFLAALLAARAGGPAAALAAAAAVLWPQFARFELFWQGVNDLLPTVLALGALAIAAGRRTRGAGLAAGVLVGLSLAAKPLPGALLLLVLPFAVPRLPLAAGIAVGLVPYLPDVLATPRELVANLVLFNVARPGDSTGAGAALPAALAGLPTLAGIGGALWTAAAFRKSARSARDVIAAAALAATLFVAGGKIIHRNYLLWWLPLAAAALGALAYREDAPPAPGTPG
ncbi:MAG: hypothetical protein ACJ79R_16320 [Anaeromyxobacteraceae bacterium]